VFCHKSGSGILLNAKPRFAAGDVIILSFYGTERIVIFARICSRWRTNSSHGGRKTISMSEAEISKPTQISHISLLHACPTIMKCLHLVSNDIPRHREKKGLSFISNRQRRKEDTFCASEMAGIESTPPAPSKTKFQMSLMCGGKYETQAETTTIDRGRKCGFCWTFQSAIHMCICSCIITNALILYALAKKSDYPIYNCPLTNGKSRLYE
jgi:hypothetical protein